MKRVEIEFIKGNDNWRERRVFEAETVTLELGEYIHIQSSKDGEFYCNLVETRVLWISIDPIEINTSDIDARILQQMDPSTNYNQLINGIKLCREITGRGLREAKEYCEALRDKARNKSNNMPY